MHKRAVCTLFEGDYYKGAIALINSLAFHGYEGDVYLGIRKQANYDTFFALLRNFPNTNGQYRYSDHLNIIVVPVETSIHFASYKPTLLLNILMQIDTGIDELYYFDPDIVVNYSWNWYDMWIDQGIPVVHEIIYNDMPQRHPIRQLWEKVICDNNLGTISHRINSYINAGFVGIKRTQISFLEKWETIIQIAQEKYGCSLTAFAAPKREAPFRMLDQDAFNIALMCTEHPISEMGCSAMGQDFNGLQVMLHAIGTPKPWRKHFLRSMFNAQGPSSSDKGFIQFANSERLSVYSPFQMFCKKIAIHLSAFLHRFYGK